MYFASQRAPTELPCLPVAVSMLGAVKVYSGNVFPNNRLAPACSPSVIMVSGDMLVQDGSRRRSSGRSAWLMRCDVPMHQKDPLIAFVLEDAGAVDGRGASDGGR